MELIRKFSLTGLSFFKFLRMIFVLGSNGTQTSFELSDVFVMKVRLRRKRFYLLVESLRLTGLFVNICHIDKLMKTRFLKKACAQSF